MRTERGRKNGRPGPVRAGICLLAAAFLACGCGKTGEKAPAAPANGEKLAGETASVVVVMPPSSEPEAGFDPAYGWGAGEHVHEPLIQSTLTVTRPDLTIDYDLATDLSVSEDGRCWTVRIRDDVKFSDGKALTASDVAFTYNTLRDTSSVNDFTMLDRAEAVDETTVRFYMKRPYAIWPYTMAVTGILPEHAYGKDYGSHPVGSGRYCLKQWDRGQQVILEANPEYYGEKPEMERVTVLFMEEDAAFAAVRSGQVDLAYSSALYGEQQVSGYELLACETVDNRGFNLPSVPARVQEDGTVLGNDFTADVRVRQAISLAMDREAMIDHVLGGYGQPAYSVCDKMPWYTPFSEVKTDSGEAVRLLEEAGWSMGQDGIREKDGIPARLEFLYPADDSIRQALAADAASQLKELGIDASVRGVGWDTAYREAQSQPLLWGWGAHTPMELYNIYHTDGETGLARYSPYANETVDERMDEALGAASLEESYELWKQAQWDGKTGVTPHGDAPWVWLVNVDHLYWVRNGLQVAEQKVHPHGHGWSIVNNVDQWRWENGSAR